MHAIDFLDAEPIHHAIVDHRLSAGAAFLGRLEDDGHRAVEAPRLGKIAGRAEQHRGMAVMTAGVHLAGHFRRPWLAGLFRYRQRIHVGPHADHLAGSARPPLDYPVAAEFAQLRRDRGRRLVDIILKLGLAMELTPPFGDFGQQFGEAVYDGHCRLQDLSRPAS